MGAGRGLCHKTGGYENPAIAAWAVAISLLGAISMTLLLLGEAIEWTGGLDEALKPGQYGQIMFVSRATFVGLGALYAVLCILSCAVTILGYFIWAPFLCFMCPLALINQVACLVSSGFGGYILSCVSTYRTALVDATRGVVTPPTSDFSIIFADSYAGLILFFSVASLACLAPLSRAATIDELGTMVDVMLHLPVTTGCITMGGILLFPSRQTIHIILGSAWLLAAVIAAVLVGLQKCGGVTTRISTILLAVLYLAALVLGLACLIFCGSTFIGGRKQIIAYNRSPALIRPNYVKNLSPEDFWLYKNFVLQNSGAFDLASVVVSALVCVYSFMGSAFSLRAAFGDSSALVRTLSSSSSSHK